MECSGAQPRGRECRCSSQRVAHEGTGRTVSSISAAIGPFQPSSYYFILS